MSIFATLNQTIKKEGSRPAWARGLKLLVSMSFKLFSLSRPAWARGLKLLGCAR